MVWHVRCHLALTIYMSPSGKGIMTTVAEVWRPHDLVRRQWAEAPAVCLLHGQALRLIRATRLEGAPGCLCLLQGLHNCWGCLVRMSQALKPLDIHEVCLLSPSLLLSFLLYAASLHFSWYFDSISTPAHSQKRFWSSPDILSIDLGWPLLFWMKLSFSCFFFFPPQWCRDHVSWSGRVGVLFWELEGFPRFL